MSARSDASAVHSVRPGASAADGPPPGQPTDGDPGLPLVPALRVHRPLDRDPARGGLYFGRSLRWSARARCSASARPPVHRLCRLRVAARVGLLVVLLALGALAEPAYVIAHGAENHRRTAARSAPSCTRCLRVATSPARLERRAGDIRMIQKEIRFHTARNRPVRRAPCRNESSRNRRRACSWTGSAASAKPVATTGIALFVILILMDRRILHPIACCASPTRLLHATTTDAMDGHPSASRDTCACSS